MKIFYSAGKFHLIKKNQVNQLINLKKIKALNVNDKVILIMVYLLQKEV
jgi:hypothetical protein